MTRPASRWSESRRWRAVLCAVVLAGMGPVLGAGAQEQPAGDASPAEEPARVRVSGLWFLQNREMRELLTVLEPEGRPLPVLDAAFIEDSILVLQSAMAERGYLKASGTVHLTLRGGETATYSWRAGEVPVLPRGIAAVEARFNIEPGVLYYLETLEIEGLTSLTTAQAKGYFISEGFLFAGRSARRFTPQVLKRGSESLRVELRRRGRLDAAVEVSEPSIDDTTGAVTATIRVVEGPLHQVARVDVAGEVPAAARPQIEGHINSITGAVYSPLRRQDLLQQLHLSLYAHGYAEAEVRVAEDTVERVRGQVLHALRLELDSGPLIRVGEVDFAGEDRPRDSVLRRATKVRSGQVFDRNRIEEDRLKLGGLGAFSSVRADVAPQEPGVWDLTYQLRPAKRLELGVLAGYGSYEKLRGGLELFHGNQFGRAERGRLQLVESTKSTSGEYQLTLPQVFGTTTDVSVRAFGLDREEVSFDRREAGVSVGARRHFARYGVDLAARYQYEALRAEDVVPDLRDAVPEDSRVGAVTFDISRDRRDNPLSPSSGYEFNLALETAARAIGGEVDYQRLDLQWSWHGRPARGLVLHLGVRHGVIWGFGDQAREIPINKRFFPGGESTVRGYAEGRAAPRGPNGEVIGAEVSSVVNLEGEFALLRNISAVLFVDAGLTAASVGDYPGDQLRVSAGVGLRYASLIGPIRLEYGHNIVRESLDQRGELHLSLGFPF